jgi:hypothetical protein
MSSENVSIEHFSRLSVVAKPRPQTPRIAIDDLRISRFSGENGRKSAPKIWKMTVERLYLGQQRARDSGRDRRALSAA